jgi:O-methyltransferase domain/Dimerisation domain
MTQPPPNVQLSSMLTGYWTSQAIYVAAKLGIADLLVAGPKTAEELAKAAGVQAAALYRLLRALASQGVFAEDDRRYFRSTPLSDCLRQDVPGSQKAIAIMMGEEHYRACGELLHCVRTGETGFEKVFGTPIFEYLSKHPEQAAIFDAAMVSVHGRETSAILDAYDFSGVGLLADVGGGNGSLLIGTLGRHPKINGLLFDSPGVIERAKANVEAAGLTGRMKFIAGNFFESVPAGADVYMMRHILHDWNDQQATTILRACHRAMGDSARLLVLESVIPPGNDPFFGKLLDLIMLALPGGKERTEEEYRRLFEGAGFRLTGITPTATEVSVLEARKA